MDGTDGLGHGTCEKLLLSAQQMQVWHASGHQAYQLTRQAAEPTPGKTNQLLCPLKCACRCNLITFQRCLLGPELPGHLGSQVSLETVDGNNQTARKLL